MMKASLQVREIMMLMRTREDFLKAEMLKEITGYRFKQCPIEEKMQGSETEKKESY